MKQRIYIDTSVIGGYFDEEFEKDTKIFFQSFERGEIILVISDLLESEIIKAPEFIRDFLSSLNVDYIEVVTLDAEAIKLADKYIEEKVVGHTSRADCQHIALATIHNADVLVSWNFKHIVNLSRIRGYNGINYKNGYKMLEIRTPKEIIIYGKEDE